MAPKVDGTSPTPLYSYDVAPDTDTYVVQGESTLEQVAKNIGFDPKALAAVNPEIKDGRVMKQQVINLPSIQPMQGESLMQLAARKDIEPDALREANPGIDPYKPLSAFQQIQRPPAPPNR
jgi:LysM repeat protein